MTNINWDKYIAENREVIDKFLGPNNPTYTAIALKGQVAINLGKERALDYFGALMKSGENQLYQNIYLRKLLKELRENLQHPPDTLMRFGVDSKLLLGKDKEIFTKIIKGELNG